MEKAGLMPNSGSSCGFVMTILGSASSHFRLLSAVFLGYKRCMQRVPIDSACDAHTAMLGKLSERSSHLSGYVDEGVDASLGDHCPEGLLGHALVYPRQSGPAHWWRDLGPIPDG